MKFHIPQVTGLVFVRQFLLFVIESLSDKINILDVRRLSSNVPKGTGSCTKTGSKVKEMCYGSVDNKFF